MVVDLNFIVYAGSFQLQLGCEATIIGLPSAGLTSSPSLGKGRVLGDDKLAGG